MEKKSHTIVSANWFYQVNFIQADTTLSLNLF